MAREKDYMGTPNVGFTTYTQAQYAMGSAEANKYWWKRKREEYGTKFYAVAKVGDPRPEQESLSSFSAGFVSGLRHFAFMDEETRDAFVRQWESARAVKDPVI